MRQTTTFHVFFFQFVKKRIITKTHNVLIFLTISSSFLWFHHVKKGDVSMQDFVIACKIAFSAFAMIITELSSLTKMLQLNINRNLSRIRLKVNDPMAGNDAWWQYKMPTKNGSRKKADTWYDDNFIMSEMFSI